ncbi:MAG: hypothetical protein M1828_002358 [Chrysothrix sp. TS-e1954]|nr:MAG: hypothetical protein M1828_002358 [Chrysothrix sp. TS-e1954]
MEAMTDEYVAAALKADAKSSSIKYSAVDYLPKRPIAAPKPNTRFLRNIIRDTDNHNAALLAKERREARLREFELRGKGRRAEQAGKPGAGSENGPDIAREKDHRSRRSHHRHEHDRARRRSRSPVRDRDRHARRATEDAWRKAHLSESAWSDKGGRHGERHRQHHGHHRRDDTNVAHHRSREGDDRAHSRSSSSPSATPRKRRKSHHPSTTRRSPRSSSPPHGNTAADSPLDAPSPSSSDPLDAIIGPAPPNTRIRGRGAHDPTASRSIDKHFTANYDPHTDIQPEAISSGSEDDWARALEGLRDRQRWIASGATRLREAGFSEEQVGRWERGGERDGRDVRWSKRGERREWDRGKEGEGEGEGSWGRLKGS